ncbi:hypothetical protein ELZ14_13350 [Pseudomonas brassicacearum]|nr:hypothetical protein ELZ14_13350 [Pseudomonas brassicacearum]
MGRRWLWPVAGFRSPIDTLATRHHKSNNGRVWRSTSLMVAVCGRSSGLPSSSYPRSANPHAATTRSFRSELQ